MSDVVKLPHITDEVCPHCEATITKDYIQYSLDNRVLDIYREFACGYYIHVKPWSKYERWNSENGDIASCHNSQPYKDKIKKEADRIKHAIEQIDQMDVDSTTKEDLKKALPPLPWEHRSKAPF